MDTVLDLTIEKRFGGVISDVWDLLSNPALITARLLTLNNIVSDVHQKLRLLVDAELTQFCPFLQTART